MLGGLYGLSFFQHLYLLIAQLTPLLMAMLGILVFEDGLITLLGIQAVYILMPQYYIRYLSKEGELMPYFINEFRTKSQQVKEGLSLCGSAFGMVVLSYGFTYFFQTEAVDMIRFPLKTNILYLLTFFLVFAFINPALEEWFWRVFLMKTYRGTDFNRLMINLAYTTFHYVILYKLFGWEMAAGFTTYFYSVSRAFEYIREKYGLITSLMTHYGMTFASSLALGSLVVMQIEQKKLA